MFVKCNRKFINLDKVKDILDGDILGDYFDTDMIVSMTAAQEGWEYLASYKDEDGTKGATSYPVMAWGLTIMGEIVHVIPDEMAIGEPHALRYKDKIYVNELIFNTVEEWLNTMK